MSKGGEQERHNSLTSFFTIRLKRALRDSLGLQGSQGTPRGEEAWITGLRATQCRTGNPPQKESLACSVALGFIFKYPRVSCDRADNNHRAALWETVPGRGWSSKAKAPS